MIKFISLASVSVLSSIYCNVVSATSCTNLDVNGYEKDVRLNQVFSICFDDDGHDEDSHKRGYLSAYAGRHHGSDDEDSHAGGHGQHYSRPDGRDGADHDSSEHHSKHDFDWSDYALEKHDHGHSDDGYGYHGDADDHESHHYRHHHEHEYQNLPGNGYGAAVVPVPSAAWLFASGLLGLALVSRRKRIH